MAYENINYYSIYTFKPLGLKEYEDLSKLGVIVPFDSSNTEFNNYAYIREDTDASTLKKIKAITGDYKSLPGSVSLDKIRKHTDRIEEDNSVEVGDTVFYLPYKKLPFLVTAVIGDRVTIFHKMRNESLSLEVQQLEIHKAPEEDIQEELIYKFNKAEFIGLTRTKYVLIDCDFLPSVGKFSHISEYIRVLIRAKLYYPEFKPILVNPCDDPLVSRAVEYMGVGLIHCDVFKLSHYCSGKEHIILSNNRTLTCFESKIYNMAEDNIEKSKISSGEAVIYLASLLNRVKTREMILRYISGDVSILNRPEIEVALQFIEKIESEPSGNILSKILHRDEAKPDELRELLNDCGGSYLADVVDNILEVVLW